MFDNVQFMKLIALIAVIILPILSSIKEDEE